MSTKRSLGKVEKLGTLLFFKGAVYDFTLNKEGELRKNQMGLMYDIPSQEYLDQNNNIDIFVAELFHPQMGQFN